jgi:hypothetical protein
MNYVTVNLPRAGIGHSLESFSRAFVYYAEGNAEFIHPVWAKLKIGPFIRGEMDKRQYWSIIKTPKSWGYHPINRIRMLGLNVVNESTFDPSRDGQFLIVKDEGPHSFAKIQPHKHLFF